MAKEIKLKNVEEAQHELAKLSLDASLNKPTEEETLAAEKEFGNAQEAFKIKTYAVGEVEDFDKISNFILDYLENYVYWTKNGWMGVLKLHEEVTETRKNHKEGEAFTLGYEALEFTFYALTNPGGSGMSSAKAIEKVADVYIKVMELGGIELEKARAEIKELQWLQDKWNAMLQGFYLEREDGIEKLDGIPNEKPNEKPNENKDPNNTFKSPSPDDLLEK